MNKASRIIPVFLLALMAALVPARPCGAVILRPAVEVKGSIVRLSDVFDGLPADTDRDIARAPAPGKSITYNVNVLVNLARQYQLGWKPQSMADQTVVTTASTRITADDIRAAVIEKIRADDVKGDIDVMFDSRTLEINLPADRAPNFLLNNFNYDETNRRFRADLAADGGVTPVSLPVTGRVVVRREVPVLRRRLEAGTVIGAADLDWLRIEDRNAADIVMGPSGLIGQELRHDVSENQPLHARDVMPPRLVTRGALITMKIETPLMMVTAQGKALQDGTMGDVVRVTNTQSSRMLEGIVAGPGVVRIPTAQRLASATAGEREER